MSKILEAAIPGSFLIGGPRVIITFYMSCGAGCACRAMNKNCWARIAVFCALHNEKCDGGRSFRGLFQLTPLLRLGVGGAQVQRNDDYW
jgi:hypothetical protein